MRYVPPAGSNDPNAPYSGAVTGSQQQGSKVTPEAIESPLRELAHLIEAAGLTPTGADLYQVLRAIRSGQLEYFEDTSTAPGVIQVATVRSPAVHSAHIAGLPLFVKLNQDVSGSTTLVLDGLPARAVYHSGGGQLFKGDYRKGDVIELRGTGDAVAYTVHTPVAGFVIDAVTAKTAHGTNADFIDINQFAAWLSRRRIDARGRLDLTLPNASGAQRLVYAADIVLDHPDLSRVTINGQPLAAAVPNAGGFTITGYGNGNRIADTATNLATLRTLFQTEIAFTGGHGFKVYGSVSLSNLLITSDGVSGTGLGAIDTLISFGANASLANVWTAGSGYRGICCAAGSLTLKGSCGAIGGLSDGISAERSGTIYVQGSAVALSNGARGIRAFLGGQVLSADLVASALAAYGNASDGIASLEKGTIQAASASAAKTNGGSGFAAIDESLLVANGAVADGNAVDGFQSWFGSQLNAQNSTGTNGRYGYFGDHDGKVFRTGGTCTGASAQASPAIGSSGNSNATVY